VKQHFKKQIEKAIEKVDQVCQLVCPAGSRSLERKQEASCR